MTLVLLLAALFGGADQYLGSLSAHPWAADVSLLSAPWLLVAFAAGWTERRPVRAALLGLAATAVALTAYGLMTLSPIEGAHVTVGTARGFAASEVRVLVGAVVTGPLFGYLGHRRRLLLVAIPLCLEPLAHDLAGSPIRFETVSVAEVAAGAALAAYAASSFARQSGSSARSR